MGQIGVGGMEGRQFVAPVVGVLAVVLLAAAYIAPPYLHWPVDRLDVLAAAIILLAGISVASFVRGAMARPAYPYAGRVTTLSPLNQPPVLNLIGKFHDPEFKNVSVTMAPGDMAAEILGRHSELKDPEKHQDKHILLTLRAGRKDFSPLDIRKVFTALTAFKHFYHVLLLDEKGEFAAYLPVEGCKRDFTGDNAESKITDLIIEVLADPKKSGVDTNKQRDMVHGIKGAVRGDTVDDEMDIRDAARKMRDDEKVQTLIVMHKGKPFGTLDKQTVLELATTGA